MNEARLRGIIAWFAYNPVAANLLMLLIIVAGVYAGLNIQRAVMPNFDIDLIQITMVYPGAAPEEVEQGIVLKIEEALSDLDGIQHLESEARESFAFIFIEPEDTDATEELFNEVKTRIDAIPHFPEGAEKPIVGRIEPPLQALILQVTGDLDERSMKELAEQVKLDLIAHPDISSVDIWGARDYEIAIEISEHQLRQYHLTLQQVASIVAASSIDLPGGAVRTENGDIMLRTQGQAYRQADFEDIVLKTFPDGTRLTLGEVAEIEDGFTDSIGFTLFDGKFSIGLPILARGEQDIIKAAHAAKTYVEEKNQLLPDGVELVIWADVSFYVEDRLVMMLKNLSLGALVVFLILALFLEIKLAFWVMVGIPICFLGSLAVFASPLIDGTLNIVSLFGFILVLGIVVDDAIIVGESAATEREARGRSVDSIIRGTHRVAIPASFGVLTTIMAFAPQLFLEGVFASFGAALGWVVVLCLVFSLIESKWILPAHLAHSKPSRARWLIALDRVRQRANQGLRYVVERRHLPLVERCIGRRYLTVGVFASILILTVGLIAGGQVRVILTPSIEGEFIAVDVSMAEGTPQRRTLEVVADLKRAIEEVEREYQQQQGHTERILAHTYARSDDPIKGNLQVELTRPEQRSIGTMEVVRRWRNKVGSVDGAESISFNATDGPSFGPDLSFDLKHSDWQTLEAASLELEEKLRNYDGIYDIRNSASDAADEFHIDILPQAEALGITRLDLGRQVRHAFYGAEAQRIQRGIHEIKVMVRYPEADRRDTASLSNMFIRTARGDEVPFDSVATLQMKPGLSKITHINFQRAVEIEAEAETERVQPGRVTSEVMEEFLPELAQKYPGLSYTRSGMSDEEEKAVSSMTRGLIISLFGIYALLAIPTRSYFQPLIIMGVIPFGAIGAVLGHMITGYTISVMSLMGLVALSGVVVNDSLILIHYVNRRVREGAHHHQAVVEASSRRFRAILLTSLTTFFALVPILTESSTQAQVVIPMAVSLAFGIVFATTITLLLVPSLYMIQQDLKAWWTRGRSGDVQDALTTGSGTTAANPPARQ